MDNTTYEPLTVATLESITASLCSKTDAESSTEDCNKGFKLKTFEEFQQMIEDRKSTPEHLQRTFNYLIDEIGKLTDKIKEKGLQNEQWALDGMDRLNKISVKF